MPVSRVQEQGGPDWLHTVGRMTSRVHGWMELMFYPGRGRRLCLKVENELRRSRDGFGRTTAAIGIVLFRCDCVQGPL